MKIFFICIQVLVWLLNEFDLLWDLKVATLILIRFKGFENPTKGEVTHQVIKLPLLEQ